MVIIKDRVVDELVRKLLHRSEVGLKKYGVGLDRKDLSTRQWLIHLQEELLDAAGYVESLLAQEEEVYVFVERDSSEWYRIPEKLLSEFYWWLVEGNIAGDSMFESFKCSHPSSYKVKLQPEKHCE